MPASPTQLRLLPPPRLLDERLGSLFFRQLPRAPGVYRLLGTGGQLLYVGKAGDLRQRLGSYRTLTHASRKTIRLVHEVRAITWEVCVSEEAATLRENELLRTHRPRFNRAGVWPQANGFLELVRAGNTVRLRFVRRTDLEADHRIVGWHAGNEELAEAVFGAFKPSARLACSALARLLWGHREDWPEPASLPRSILWSGRPPEYLLSHLSTRVTELLIAFLSGRSGALLNEWVGFAEVPGSMFLREFWRGHWELAREFFRTGPARNRAMRERFGGGNALIGESELDDLLVRWRRDRAA